MTTSEQPKPTTSESYRVDFIVPHAFVCCQSCILVRSATDDDEEEEENERKKKIGDFSKWCGGVPRI